MTREELTQAVTDAQSVLTVAHTALREFNSRAANNVYETLQLALNTVEYQLHTRAVEACEGAGNCGLSEYSQLFMVDNVTYIGMLKVEYNRHDKTYYYVDWNEFTYGAI